MKRLLLVILLLGIIPVTAAENSSVEDEIAPKVFISGSHSFYDFDKNRLTLHASTKLQLYKGLSFYIHGGVSMIHDQYSLPKRDASTEEILLKRRQLETHYSYWSGIGIEFTFGSIYNNIVNPRFGD